MSKLYIVATPIGNLKDISLRALEVFKSVDAILCEDTRVTSRLLERYDIKKPLIAYHQHSAKSVSRKIIKMLDEGQDLALVSDAGTPGIQDPGNKIISELCSSKVKIIPIPGPSAVTALLSVSGLPTDSFLFLGFVPKKKGKQKVLREIMESERTVVFYESGRRVLRTLADLREIMTQTDAEKRQIVVGRELTKKFETIYRGTLSQALAQIKKGSQKGEFVVVVSSQ